MIRLIWESILDRWQETRWKTPLPTLDRHLEHIAGGALVVMFATLFLPPFWAHVASSVLFALVEFVLAPILRTGLDWNWRDSVMDFWQYQFHWVLFLAASWFWIPALIVWFAVYFVLLLKGW